jgi:hypothetical protein
MLISSCLFFVNLRAFFLALSVLAAFVGWLVVIEMLGVSTRKNTANIPADNTCLIAKQINLNRCD